MVVEKFPMAHSAVAQNFGRQKHLRELGLPTLFGAVVLLCSATLLLFVNVAALRGSLDAIDHSQKVLNLIADLETGVLGDQLSVRGYALTGDARFLTYHETEKAKCEAARAELLQLTESEPRHASAYRAAMQNVLWHIETFAKLSGNGPERAAVVAKAIVDPVIRSKMRNTRNGLAALRKQEMGDVAERQRLMADQITRAFVLAAGIIVVAFVLGGIGVWAARLPFQRLSGP